MSRLVLPALLVTAATTLGAATSGARVALTDRLEPRGATTGRVAMGADATCPANTLPDGNACVRLPLGDSSGEDSAPETPSVQNAHHEKSGQFTVYDQIPRRPDRPADYDLYRYPIPPGMPGGHSVVSGYDLDRPDDRQRRGATLSHVGHGGVDLPQRKGLPIPMLYLEHQQGPAVVLYVGPLFGTTVVTKHTLREGDRDRDYVLLYGHLDAPAPGLAKGQELREGDLVGFVGDTSSPELVHLHIEARRVREDVDITKYTGGQLLRENLTVVCDPRNVLPLK